MSIQSALSEMGISESDYKCFLRAKKVANDGFTAEIRKDLKTNELKVYKVQKNQVRG